MVYVLAVTAALIVGIGTVLEQRAASQAPPEFNLSPRLLVYLVQRPLWLSGAACSLLGNLVFAAALGLGAVALVTAVFVLRLLFALTLAAAWGRHRVPARDLAGALAVVVGLAGFILAARPREGDAAGVPDLAFLVGGGSVVVFALALTTVARQVGPVRKAVLLGTGAGALFGLQASLMHTAVGVLTGPGIVALLTSWPGYAVVATALLGMLLVQSAYEAAPLPASYPGIVTTELLCGIALGVWLLGGVIRLDPVGLTIGALGILAMIVGIYLLTTSPLVTGQLDQLVRQQEIGQARQIEAWLDRELRRLDRDMLRAESRFGSARSGAPPPRRLQRELDRVGSGIDRLLRLQEDIGRHRDAERERLGRSSGAERAELAEQDRELRAQEDRIEERARELRDRAHRLGAPAPRHTAATDAAASRGPGAGR